MRRQGSRRERAPGRPHAGSRWTPCSTPRSVAVVGASDDSASGATSSPGGPSRRSGDRAGAAGQPARRARCSASPTYPSAGGGRAPHGAAVDLVVVCVPAGRPRRRGDRRRRGRCPGDRGDHRRALRDRRGRAPGWRRRRCAIARAAGAVLVGPELPRRRRHRDRAPAQPTPCCPPGDVAVLSQSGNLVLDLAGAAGGPRAGRLPVRLARQPGRPERRRPDGRPASATTGTRAVAVYAEDVVDGRGVRRRRPGAASTPASRSSCWRPGRSEAAVRSAASHTGSLTSASQVVDAACAAAGVHRVDHPTQMADLLRGAARRPRGCPAGGSRSSPTAAGTARSPPTRSPRSGWRRRC